MKKLFVSIGLSLLGITALIAAGGTGYTGAPAPSVIVANLSLGVPQTILTNNVTVQQVQLTTTASGSIVSFYDCSSTNYPYWGTNGVTASYATTSGFATNYVTSFVGYNGYTNYYTNTGWWTFAVTNAAATNALAPEGVLYALSGAVTTGNTPMSFRNGVSIVAQSNTTAVIWYTPNK